MDPKRVKSLGYFGFSLALWLNFPVTALHFGNTFSTFAVTASALLGMYKL